jgi:hypothetical protein
LPAAKAALVALMQTTNNAAATISIVNLMADLPFWRCTPALHAQVPQALRAIISPRAGRRCREIGPVLA